MSIHNEIMVIYNCILDTHYLFMDIYNLILYLHD